MDVTRERIRRILELREILLSFQTGFNLVNAAVVCAILESISGLEPSSVITEPRYLTLVTQHKQKMSKENLPYFTLYLLADALPNYPSVEPVLSDKQKIDSKGKRNLELLTLSQNYFAYRFIDFFPL